MLQELVGSALNSMAFNLIVFAKASRLQVTKRPHYRNWMEAEGYIVKVIGKG